MSIQMVGWALDQFIPQPGPKLVLIALANAANGKHNDACFPPKKQLAKDTSMSERTITRHVQWLETNGFIRVERRFDGDTGRTVSNRYFFLRGEGDKMTPPEEKPQKSQGDNLSPCDTAVTGEGDTAVTLISIKPEDRTGNTPVVPKKVEVDFADIERRFWANYPKRLGSNPKKPANDKLRVKIKAGADPERIIAGAGAYASEQQRLGKVGTEYIAQAVTWINQERWDDHLPAAPVPGAPPPPTVDPATIPPDRWWSALQIFSQCGAWPGSFGPPPTAEGNHVPPDMRAQFERMHGPLRAA